MGFIRRIKEILIGTPSPLSEVSELAECAETEEIKGEGPEPVVITDCLDLHGYFPQQARPMIREFIWGAHEQGYGLVRIIHGKGRGVMKTAVREELSRHPMVVDFHNARDLGGNWGATVVQVRTKTSEQPPSDL